MSQNLYTSKSTEIPFSIRISGIGGQGNVLLGTILSDALAKEGKWVVQTQSYGAQVRGGLTNCDVLFFDEPIDFPQVKTFDIFFAMHDIGLKAHFKYLKNNGIIFVDSSMCSDIPSSVMVITKKIVSVPITQKAEEIFGRHVFANAISLGLIAATTRIVGHEALEDAIKENVPQKYIDENLKALDEGYKLSTKVFQIRKDLKMPYSKGTNINFE
ncbi:2-oxoacid:acceptor oxidoreductase family protein [Athalassotoga saccharophila]|uniref:2-oxoacid:acceptor oxidoreductase family protein n=1 Tax=Athalassotoga saccharophila TaxID=1441386 RepID=UPI00137A4EB6|nr:2-oxoacid:acceptor oxidoreductase family protein [Athalassotoga saccharophila]BBJ27243.1 2-oxoglutarate/2-oxoacid ferredoxin oxidoreductase, gamma subunit [Athalassotoga saccharophila]